MPFLCSIIRCTMKACITCVIQNPRLLLLTVLLSQLILTTTCIKIILWNLSKIICKNMLTHSDYQVRKRISVWMQSFTWILNGTTTPTCIAWLLAKSQHFTCLSQDAMNTWITKILLNVKKCLTLQYLTLLSTNASNKQFRSILYFLLIPGSSITTQKSQLLQNETKIVEIKEAGFSTAGRGNTITVHSKIWRGLKS